MGVPHAMAAVVAPLPAAAMPVSPTGSQRYDHIEAALRRLDVSLAVAVRWQATWVMMSIVVLVTQIEVAWFHNTGDVHTSRSCRVAQTTSWNSSVLTECLDAPAFVPYAEERLLLNMLRSVNSVLTVLLLASVAKYHHSQYLIKKLSDVEPVSLPFWASSVVRPPPPRRPPRVAVACVRVCMHACVRGHACSLLRVRVCCWVCVCACVRACACCCRVCAFGAVRTSLLGRELMHCVRGGMLGCRAAHTDAPPVRATSPPRPTRCCAPVHAHAAGVPPVRRPRVPRR